MGSPEKFKDNKAVHEPNRGKECELKKCLRLNNVFSNLQHWWYNNSNTKNERPGKRKQPKAVKIKREAGGGIHEHENPK